MIRIIAHEALFKRYKTEKGSIAAFFNSTVPREENRVGFTRDSELGKVVEK